MRSGWNFDRATEKWRTKSRDWSWNWRHPPSPSPIICNCKQHLPPLLCVSFPLLSVVLLWGFSCRRTSTANETLGSMPVFGSCGVYLNFHQSAITLSLTLHVNALSKFKLSILENALLCECSQTNFQNYGPSVIWHIIKIIRILKPKIYFCLYLGLDHIPVFFIFFNG